MTETFYSAIFPDNAPADRAQRQTGLYLLETMRADPPGYQTANRIEQAQHFTDVIYIAIRAIMDIIGGSTAQLQRYKRNKSKTTFGPNGTHTKAMPSIHDHQEDWVQVDDHPVVELLQRPNELESFPEVRTYLTLQNKLCGIAPLWTVPNPGRKPVELWALPTALTEPLYQRTSQYPHGAWRVQPYYLTGGLGYVPSPFTGTGAIIPGEEMATFKDEHPFFKWDGYSALTAGGTQLDVLEAIDDARHSAMESGVTMDAVLTVSGMDDPAINRFESKINNKHAGARNARRFMVLSSPNANEKVSSALQTFSQSPKEMDFYQSREQMTIFALALFGVPGSVAGIKDAVSYSELYASLRQFYQRQHDYVRRQDQFFTKTLCWPYEKKRGEYRIKTDLPKLDDPELQARQFERNKDIMSVNERRRLDGGLPPVRHGNLPVQVWSKIVEQEAMPKQPPQPSMGGGGPAPAPGGGGPQHGPDGKFLAGAAGPAQAQPMPGQPAPGPAPQPSPLLAPTGGAAPQPPNPDAEGTGTPLQPGALQKAFPDNSLFAQDTLGHPHAEEHKYSCVYLELPKEVANQLQMLGKMIPTYQLVDKGVETDSHVTARFGLHGSDHMELLPILGNFGPVTLKLGKVTCFRNPEFDVLKVDVESPELRKMHAALGALEHTDTHKEFNPHATIAYVRSGVGPWLAARMPAIDREVTVDRAIFSNQKREHATISLVSSGGATGENVTKAMTAGCEATGGTLVKPPAQGKPKKKKITKLARSYASSLLKGLAGDTHKKHLGFPRHSYPGGEEITGHGFYRGGEYLPLDSIEPVMPEEPTLPEPEPTISQLPPEADPRLTPEQEQALKDFIETHHVINESLEKGDKLEGAHAAIAQHLQNVFDGIPTFKSPVLVHHTLSLPHAIVERMAADMKKAQGAQKTLLFPGFQRSSTSDKIPEGHNVAFHFAAVHGLGVMDKEALLMNRGSRFRVTGVDRAEADMENPGILHVTMEHVPPGEVAKHEKKRLMQRLPKLVGG